MTLRVTNSVQMMDEMIQRVPSSAEKTAHLTLMAHLTLTAHLTRTAYLTRTVTSSDSMMV